MSEQIAYKKKDFVSDQEVRWCPGCGDYAILSSLQMAMTKIGRKKEDIVCISGIGCSSRLPYYMDTYGLHTIHGRAPAVATGAKLANPDLSVWIITGDGDGLSIGGNHLIHLARRNINCNVLLFNNEIYGLTKGQFSPTSQQGTVTKSTPYGSISRAFRPGKVMLGSEVTFLAKTIDTDPKSMIDIFVQAEEHKGTSFIEIYQNCVIFNDKVHDLFTNRATRDEHTVVVEHGKPMIFGKNKDKAIVADGFDLKVVQKDAVDEKDILVHDCHNAILASILVEKSSPPDFPMFLGVIYKQEAPTYEDMMFQQMEETKVKQTHKTVEELLYSGHTWQVNE